MVIGIVCTGVFFILGKFRGGTGSILSRLYNWLLLRSTWFKAFHNLKYNVPFTIGIINGISNVIRPSKGNLFHSGNWKLEGNRIADDCLCIRAKRCKKKFSVIGFESTRWFKCRGEIFFCSCVHAIHIKFIVEF